MTAILFRHVHAPGTSRRRPLRYRLNEAAQRAFATVRTWHRRTVERHELAALDDRTLKDIGLSRADALYLGNKPFWKE